MSGTAVNPQLIPTATANKGSPNLAKTYGFSLALVSGTIQSVDLRFFQNLNVLQEVQGIYLDNSANTTALTVTIPSGQTIVIPPNGQAMMPVYVALTTPVFTFAGNGNVGIILNNFPTPASVWVSSNQTIPVTGGLVQTQDVALDGIIINGALSTSGAMYGPGDVINHKRNGQAYTGSLANGTTTLIAGTPSCFVTDIDVAMDPQAVMASLTDVTIAFQFVTAGLIITRTAQINTAGLTGNAGPINIIKLSGASLLGAVTSDSLQVVVSGLALTAGAIRYTVLGGTTGLM